MYDTTQQCAYNRTEVCQQHNNVSRLHTASRPTTKGSSVGTGWIPVTCLPTQVWMSSDTGRTQGEQGGTQATPKVQQLGGPQTHTKLHTTVSHGAQATHKNNKEPTGNP